LWQVPSETHGEFQVSVLLNVIPFAADNSQPSKIKL
jgi:hypothetical protein